MSSLIKKLRMAYLWRRFEELFSWVAKICLLVLFWWVTVKAISDNIGAVNPNIVVATIAAFATLIGYFVNRRFERIKIIEQQIREKKIPVYEDFISFVIRMMIGKESVSEDELLTFISEFNQKSIVWLSDESIIAYSEWIQNLRTGTEDKTVENTVQNLVNFEDLLLQFRKDIGHSNDYLVKGDILRIFINDLDKYDLIRKKLK
ncbi:hypothetical protein [Dyadobacter chenhuakuii]|uniref:Uncharacterized protein n=1 Tax=Dyadobacter chenhuakuii TaxID=2909339 RepID=A0A9X1TTH6_9BACT|nr:hypothetical protein [Dyadobacter chenhuakuii]MCF2498353.1 hypothetical protein [Dyadobacter chenhuakuii]